MTHGLFSVSSSFLFVKVLLKGAGPGRRRSDFSSKPLTPPGPGVVDTGPVPESDAVTCKQTSLLKCRGSLSSLKQLPQFVNETVDLNQHFFYNSAEEEVSSQ